MVWWVWLQCGEVAACGGCGEVMVIIGLCVFGRELVYACIFKMKLGDTVCLLDLVVEY